MPPLRRWLLLCCRCRLSSFVIPHASLELSNLRGRELCLSLPALQVGLRLECAFINWAWPFLFDRRYRPFGYQRFAIGVELRERLRLKPHRPALGASPADLDAFAAESAFLLVYIRDVVCHLVRRHLHETIQIA